MMGSEKDPSDFAQLLAYLEEAKQERELAFSVLNRINDGFVALDKSWRYVYLNQRAAEMLKQKSPGDLLGKHIWTEYPEGVGQPFYHAYCKAMDTQEPQFLEENYQPWDLWFENRIYPSPEGLSIFFTEITARKRTEAALIASKNALRIQQAQLETITTHAPDAIVQIGLDGQILFVNRVENGVSYEEVVGRNWTELMYEPDKPIALEAFDVTRSQGLITEYEVRGRGAHGIKSWFRCRLSPVKVEGEVRSLVLFCTEITEQKQAAEERIRLEAALQHGLKLDSLGRLASGVAHDMNNVLGAILGLASVTQDKGLDSDTKSAMETIIKACHRGRKMVRSLLDFSRKELADRQILDLNSIIEEEAGLLEHTTLQKVSLKLDLARPLNPVMGDSSALSQALMNLCVNAVDAMPQGGILCISTQNEGAGIEICVSDTGEGMAPDVLKNALDPFFTTKPLGQGTGLGLSSVFAILKAHGGSMDIQSQEGRGTRIALHLPGIATESSGPEPTAEASGSPAQLPTRLLLIDDDELIRLSMAVVFQTLGLEGHMADSGESALALLEGGFTPDCVILDMNMPGIGGSETLARLRRLLPEVPVLLATGRADQSAVNLANAYPGVVLMAKPFTLEEFRKQLSALQTASADRQTRDK